MALRVTSQSRLGSLSIIAFKINDTEMLRFLFILAASVMGFCVKLSVWKDFFG